MADVTYNIVSFPALVNVINMLIKTSQNNSPSQKSPLLLLAYKERDPSERELWTMLHDIGVDLVLVQKIPGAGGEPVEIWVCSNLRSTQGTDDT